MKRTAIILLVAIFSLMLSAVSFAAVNDDVFEGYDSYYEFEDGKKAKRPATKPQKPWYYKISVVPVVLGAAAGAGAVTVLYRKTVSVEEQLPMPNKPTIKQDVIDKHDFN